MEIGIPIKKFEIYLSDQTWFIYRIGDFVHFSGYVSIADTPAWTWVANFVEILNKPQHNLWFYVNNKHFNLSTDGFIQCAENIPAGTYPFELTWKASS